MKNKFYSNLVLFWIILGIVFPPLTINNQAYAALRISPTWYDVNTVGLAPDWHYRVPINTPSNTAINSTVSVDIDFNALLSALGVSGTIDVNSPRIVRPNGVISTIQEFNRTIYNNATNSITTRGNIRFIAEDVGVQTYYLYFDITQNGTKPINPQSPINGTFEQGQGTANGATINGWNAPVRTNTVFDAQVRPSETVTVVSDGTVVNGQPLTRSTNGTSLVGGYTYLIGARTNNEPNTTGTGVTITKTIRVPSVNPGNLVFRYRIEGWDSNVNGNTNQYDYFSATINGSTTVNMVGPVLNNYVTYPFSPNYGTNPATTTNYGYGQYNSWDMGSNGTNLLGMTLNRGAEPWFTVTQSLAAFAGQTITLTFSTYHTNLYKTWVSLANIEWSMVSGTVGTPQAFGVQVTNPTVVSTLLAGTKISITAKVDASPTTFVTANIYNSSGAVVATGIRLYNDGTRGSNATTPSLWTNDGSDNANPTYTIPILANNSNTWLVRAFALDGSTSTIVGTTNGLIRQVGAANTPLNENNYFNIGENNFNINGIPSFTNVKSVSIVQDPINGTTNPKAIPGGEALYQIIISNNGGNPDVDSVIITDQIPNLTSMYVGDLGASGSGPLLFTDGSTSSGLSYNFISLGNASSGLKFSNNNAVTWTYIPVADINGFDSNITNIKINLTGTMNAFTTIAPSFSLKFKVRIK